MKNKYIFPSVLLATVCTFLLLVGCSSVEKNPVYANDYQKALQDKAAINLQQAGLTADWVGERFSGVMNQFKAEDVESLAYVY